MWNRKFKFFNFQNQFDFCCLSLGYVKTFSLSPPINVSATKTGQNSVEWKVSVELGNPTK